MLQRFPCKFSLYVPRLRLTKTNRSKLFRIYSNNTVNLRYTREQKMIWDFLAIKKTLYISSIVKKKQRAALQFKTKSILSSFSEMQQQSDLCLHYQRNGLHRLKCRSVRFQLNGPRSRRWWMKGKVDKDVVNVAPNPCVSKPFFSTRNIKAALRSGPSNLIGQRNREWIGTIPAGRCHVDGHEARDCWCLVLSAVWEF